MIPKQLFAALKNKKNKVFVVAAHIHLEGDAIGSELAMAGLLEALGKKVIVINEDLPPAEYNFLPGLKAIRHKMVSFDYDVAVLLDCSSVSRIGKAAKIIRKDRLLINIDHHVSNTRFADINWVSSKASSASEMVYELFKTLRVKMEKKDALFLYTGILADTGSFRYSTTTAFTHQMAADLLGYGLDVYGIYRYLHENKNFATVKALGKILQTLRKDKSGRVAWLEVRAGLIKKNPELAEQTDDIIQFARSLKQVEVALLFKEVRANQEVRINFRSCGKADVNKIASLFGGGGHKMASGATVRGRFKDIVAEVVKQARKRL
jgi:phosphoesterase RecJ-like protein